jgi:Flp pilus assembly protein TadD
VDPEDAEAHDDLGGLLVKLGRRDEAIAQFNEALHFKPDDKKAGQNLRELGVEQ